MSELIGLGACARLSGCLSTARGRSWLKRRVVLSDSVFVAAAVHSPSPGGKAANQTSSQIEGL